MLLWTFWNWSSWCTYASKRLSWVCTSGWEGGGQGLLRSCEIVFSRVPAAHKSVCWPVLQPLALDSFSVCLVGVSGNSLWSSLFPSCSWGGVSLPVLWTMNVSPPGMPCSMMFACFLVALYFSRRIQLTACWLWWDCLLYPLPLLRSPQWNKGEHLSVSPPCGPFLTKQELMFCFPFRCEWAEVCCCWWLLVSSCRIYGIHSILPTFFPQFSLIEILNPVKSTENPKYPSYNEHNPSTHC